jgi:Mg-chelatase subunit ChlD
MADSRLYVHVLLDRSGSMESCRDKTIEAFNAYVKSVKEQSTAGTRISLTTFDTESTDLVFDGVRIADMPRLTHEMFVPRGGTPLFDAVAAVVARIDKVNLLADERVALTILTDGQENSSREMSAEAVRKMLIDRQERRNWLVQYLGANQDAWEAGAQIGIAAAHAINFSVASVRPAMQSVAASAKRFRTASAEEARDAASFTPAERSSAKGGS